MAARRLTIAISLVVAIWLVAVSRWVIQDTVVPWDSKEQFFAFFRFLSATLRAGEWPFWNPYHYGGHPGVADPQSFIFSPVFLIWGMLDPAPTLRTFDIVVFAHLLVGGVAIAIVASPTTTLFRSAGSHRGELKKSAYQRNEKPSSG